MRARLSLSLNITLFLSVLSLFYQTTSIDLKPFAFASALRSLSPSSRAAATRRLCMIDAIVPAASSAQIMPRERKEETCTWKNSRTTARVEEKEASCE